MSRSPCDGQQLENIIERCFNLQDLLSEEPLRKMVGRIGKLPRAAEGPTAYYRPPLAQPSVNRRRKLAIS